jgi:hypothetical protein
MESGSTAANGGGGDVLLIARPGSAKEMQETVALGGKVSGRGKMPSKCNHTFWVQQCLFTLDEMDHEIWAVRHAGYGGSVPFAPLAGVSHPVPALPDLHRCSYHRGSSVAHMVLAPNWGNASWAARMTPSLNDSTRQHLDEAQDRQVLILNSPKARTTTTPQQPPVYLTTIPPG